MAKLLCYTKKHSGTKLATSAPAPYLLEGLSLEVHADTTSYYNHLRMTKEIATTIKSIVNFQLHNLQEVSINRIGFRNDYENVSLPEYRRLLSFSLTELLKQPQLCLLSLGQSPLPEAYELIEAFLYTQATHKQILKITGTCDSKGKEEKSDQKNKQELVLERKQRRKRGVAEAKKDSKRMKLSSSGNDKEVAGVMPERPPPSQSLPETNAQFKCLHLGHSCRCVHACGHPGGMHNSMKNRYCLSSTSGEIHWQPCPQTTGIGCQNALTQSPPSTEPLLV